MSHGSPHHGVALVIPQVAVERPWLLAMIVVLSTRVVDPVDVEGWLVEIPVRMDATSPSEPVDCVENQRAPRPVRLPMGATTSYVPSRVPELRRMDGTSDWLHFSDHPIANAGKRITR